jgi:hypothetical protein
MPVLHIVENLWITSIPCGNSVVSGREPVDEGCGGTGNPEGVDRSFRSRSTTHTVVVSVSQNRSPQLSTVPTGVKKMTDNQLMRTRSITLTMKAGRSRGLEGGGIQGTSMGEPNRMSRERQ